MERFYNYTALDVTESYPALDAIRQRHAATHPYIRSDMFSMYLLPYAHLQVGPDNFRHFYDNQSRYWCFTRDIHYEKVILGHYWLVICVHHPIMMTTQTWRT